MTERQKILTLDGKADLRGGGVKKKQAKNATQNREKQTNKWIKSILTLDWKADLGGGGATLGVLRSAAVIPAWQPEYIYHTLYVIYIYHVIIPTWQPE